MWITALPTLVLCLALAHGALHFLDSVETEATGPFSLGLYLNVDKWLLGLVTGEPPLWAWLLGISAVLGALLWLAGRAAKSRLQSAAVGLVLGSVVANMVGRIDGGVVDYVRVGQWPTSGLTFNLPDVLLLTGGVLYLGVSLRAKWRAKRPPGD